jgi:hypothetical protein
VKRELQRIEIPGEYDARRRTWDVVRAAFDEREPVSWPRRHARELAFAAAAAVLVAAAVTPPGRSVVNSIRDTVGREKVVGVPNAQRDLVRLPAPGRLLVQSNRGAWVVRRDGSRRLLGAYRDAAWSPHGKFVAGILHRRTLVALEPNGMIRWEKPHSRRLALPRWSFEGYRIAYFSGSTLRVIVGNGTSDRLLGAADARVAPAWRPGTHIVAYVGVHGAVVVSDADTKRVLWRTARLLGPRELFWSDDGARLGVLGRAGLSVFDADAHNLGGANPPGRELAAAFRPESHELAIVVHVVHSSVLIADADGLSRGPRRVFEGAGRFSDVSWSPDGRWLVVGWPSADQFVFVRVGATPKLDAVSNVTRQFLSRTFPGISGWTVSID